MSRTASERRQRGIALVLAIFIIVIVAGVIALLSQWLSLSSTASGHQSLQLRAFSAAQSGLDWGIYRLEHGQSCSAVLQLQDGSLNGFQVDVSCQSYGPISEDGQTHTWYTLTALAHSGSPGQADSVARTLEADLWL